MTSASERPILRVVHGDPSPDELAIVTAVLSAIAADAAPEPLPRPVGGWADPRRRLTSAPHPGPGGWRASGR